MSQVRAIIELATQVSYPSQAQLAAWTAYIDTGGSLDEMASAFIRNPIFGNLYNNGNPVDPNSPISADILAAIIEHSTGVLPSPTQNEQWLGSQSTTLQTFEAFALGDQFGVASQADVGHAIPGGYDPFPEFFQIYELATGNIVTDAQTISGWWQYELSGGSIRSICESFVASDMFAQNYRTGQPVDPNAQATPGIVSSIIQAATGHVASDAQVAAWAGSGLSVVGIFEAFALGDQYKAYVESQHILV